MAIRTRLEQIGFSRLAFSVFESNFEELTYTGNNLTSAIVWTDSGKTQKIREQLFTYDTGRITTEVINQYDEDGTLLETLSGVHTYVGSRLVSIDWTLS